MAQSAPFGVLRAGSTRSSPPTERVRTGSWAVPNRAGQGTMYWYKSCALLSGGTAARADAIRPYSCGGRAADGSTARRPLQGVAPSILVLPEIRGYGRMLSAPTVTNYTSLQQNGAPVKRGSVLVSSAPGERTFSRVKVPKSPSSGKT